MIVYRYRMRLTALLLAMLMVLGLTGCDGGGKNEDNKEQLSSKIYLPTYVDIDMDLRDVTDGCTDGENLYLLAEVNDGEQGEVHTAIFCMSPDGGVPKALPNFKTFSIPEGQEGDSQTSSIHAGVDGTLWVEESSSIYNFNLPEDFNGTGEEKWEYFVGTTDTQIFRQIDSTGNDVTSIDLTGLAEKLGVDYTGTINLDKDGNIYTTNGESTLFVLDRDQNLLFTLEREHLGDPVLLADGTMGLTVYVGNEENGSYGYHLCTVDVVSQSWGTEYPLSQNVRAAYPGSGSYLFYYQNNDSVYGFKAGATEGEKLFSWLDSDINRNDISFFLFLNDGRVAALSRTWDLSTGERKIKIDLAVLTAMDRSALPEKTTLTCATMYYLDYQERNSILEFNKTSDKYRIEVRDYSEYNTATDSSAGRTKLNTEIIAGNIPDIIAADSGLPLRQYGAKGILENLWPYIEQDTEIGGREGIMEHVFETAQQDGKLYQIFSTFYIWSCLGAARTVGDTMSWTLTDLQEALATMPEGCTIFGDGDTKDGMLSQILAMNMDSFVEWEEGMCHFDSDTFKSLLKFCNSFPTEFDWERVDWKEYEENYVDVTVRMAEGAQMLSWVYLGDFTDLQTYKDVLNGDVTYVGCPMEDGSVGSSFAIDSGYAMTSACKDKEGAWSFMRQMLLPKAEEAARTSNSGKVVRYNFGGFPVNKSDFNQYLKSNMTVDYETDENGEVLKDENGEPIKIAQSGRWLDADNALYVYAATQEEVDQVMALYDAITTTYNYDERIYNIISDMAGAYFAGDRSLDDTVTQIQSRVNLYMNEQI